MGQVEILQGHSADVIVIGHLHVILIALAVCPGFRPVADLHRHRLGQGILPVKECLQLTLYLVHCEHPFMERRQNGDQHIGVMADGIQIKAVFIIAGVQGLIVVQFILKVRLQSRIGRLRRQHIRVLGKIGGQEHAAHAGAAHHGAGGHPAEQKPHAGADPYHQQDHPAVPADEHHGFFRRLLCAPGCALRSGRRILRRFPGLAHLFGIVPLDTLFLQIPGNRVGGGQGRIIMERLLVEEIGICPDRSPFRFRRVPPGLHPALPDTGLHFAFPIGKAALRQFLALVPGLHAHIFLLHFMDFIVGGQKDFLGRTGERVMPQMAVRLLLHFLKAETGFPAACRFIKDTFGF